MPSVFEENGGGGYGPKYKWKCPRLGCKKEFMTYTEGALQSLINIHERDHANETADNIKKYEELKKILPPRNPNKLVLNPLDITFLKTRHIKIDEDMEVVYE